jgi:glycerol-3-phosphate acyltransferase PlsY
MAFLSDSWAALLIAAAVGYLLGSVNWAILITHWFVHKDIRTFGSGNAGATNVLRSQGTVPALLTTLGDLAKSVLATWFGGWLLMNLHMGDAALDASSLALIGRYVAGLCCVVGHVLPVFYRFRGGKGVLSTLGMFLVADWRVALLCLGLFIAIVAISRLVSLGSVVAIGYGPLLILIFHIWIDRMSVPMVVFTTVMTVVVATIIVVEHAENIKRLAQGKERRIGERA